MSVIAIKRRAKSGKLARATAARFNQRKYADLLAEALPAAITNEEELGRLTKAVDRLAVKKNLSERSNEMTR